MPELVLNLTNGEFADLESVAEARQQTPEDAGHDLLVDAVSEQMDSTAKARSHAKGVTAARRAEGFSTAFARTTKALKAGGYPARERRNL